MRNKAKRAPSRRAPARLSSSRSFRSRYAPVETRHYIDEISRGLIEDAHVGVFVFDAAGRIEFANRAGLKLFGYTKAQVLGKTTEELGILEYREDGTRIPPSLRARDRAIRSGKPVRGQVVGIRRPGCDEMQWIYGNVMPRFTNDGSFQRIVVTLSDVTDRMKARQSLERTNDFNHQILTSVQEGIIVHGPDLRYQLWNPYMERMSGLKAKDVVGKHPRELFPFLEEHGGLVAIKQALAGQVATVTDMPYEVAQTGEHGWCDNKYGPLRNESGEIVGVIATVRDVTGRKRHEDDLHQLSSRLLELQDQERRRIARDLHDSLAQDVMAAGLNLAQLRKSLALPRQKADKIIAQTQDIVTDCARQIRSLSYLLHPPLLDELGLVSAIEEYADGFSQRAGIRLEVDLQPDVGRLPQEVETALFRILQESLGNIQKHSGSKFGSIHLSRDESKIAIEVRDTGKGISGGELENEPSGAHRLGVGILGMRERMRQLGGGLEITSNGRGTTVRAVLPLKNGAGNVRSHSHRR